LCIVRTVRLTLFYCFPPQKNSMPNNSPPILHWLSFSCYHTPPTLSPLDSWCPSRDCLSPVFLFRLSFCLSFVFSPFFPDYAPFTHYPFPSRRAPRGKFPLYPVFFYSADISPHSPPSHLHKPPDIFLPSLADSCWRLSSVAAQITNLLADACGLSPLEGFPPTQSPAFIISGLPYSFCVSYFLPLRFWCTWSDAF